MPNGGHFFFGHSEEVKDEIAQFLCSIAWMHSGLPYNPLWEPMFYRLMVYGGLINQVLPRMYSKEDVARIKARTLLILGGKEMIHNHLQAARRAARELIPGVQIEVIPNAHHITALVQPEIVNQKKLNSLPGKSCPFG